MPTTNSLKIRGRGWRRFHEARAVSGCLLRRCNCATFCNFLCFWNLRIGSPRSDCGMTQIALRGDPNLEKNTYFEYCCIFWCFLCILCFGAWLLRVGKPGKRKGNVVIGSDKPRAVGPANMCFWLRILVSFYLLRIRHLSVPPWCGLNLDAILRDWPFGVMFELEIQSEVLWNISETNEYINICWNTFRRNIERYIQISEIGMKHKKKLW